MSSFSLAIRVSSGLRSATASILAAFSRIRASTVACRLLSFACDCLSLASLALSKLCVSATLASLSLSRSSVSVSLVSAAVTRARASLSFVSVSSRRRSASTRRLCRPALADSSPAGVEFWPVASRCSSSSRRLVSATSRSTPVGPPSLMASIPDFRRVAVALACVFKSSTVPSGYWVFQ